MSYVERILVPVDFSPGSQRAFEYAVFLAESLHASLDLLHVFEAPMVLVPELAADSAVASALGTASDEMGKVLDWLHLRGFGRVHSHIERGSAPDMILNHAEQGHYDLIVMGTHGRTGLACLLMGSVAEHVLRRAPCPIATIHLGNRAAESRSAPSG